MISSITNIVREEISLLGGFQFPWNGFKKQIILRTTNVVNILKWYIIVETHSSKTPVINVAIDPSWGSCG